MTDELHPQTQVYLFGFRQRVDVKLDPNPLALFVMGYDVPMTPELVAAIRAEFTAQERYRSVLLGEVQAAQGALVEQACQTVAPIEHPITDVREAFWRGYALGKYEALSIVAGALSEIQIVAALALAPEKTDADD